MKISVFLFLTFTLHQVVTVGASEAVVAGIPGSNSVSTSSRARQVVVAPASGQTSPRIKTMLAPDGTCVKTVVSPQLQQQQQPNSSAATAVTTATTTTRQPTISPTSPGKSEYTFI